MSLPLESLAFPEPNLDSVTTEIEGIRLSFLQADHADKREDAVRDWDRVRRQLDSWSALARLRFHQDTRNEEFKRLRDLVDHLNPRFAELHKGMKEVILDERHRDELREVLGSHSLSLWEADQRAFDMRIKDDLVEESRLEAEYIELLANARIPIGDQSYSLSEVRKLAEEPDRRVRKSAEAGMSDWFGSKGTQFDRIFDELVGLRAGMADQLGLDGFVELGYLRMSRVDYTREDVEGFRAEVLEHIVPLCQEIRSQQQATLGVDRLCFWDESVHSPDGNPRPLKTGKWILDQAQVMFERMGHGLGEFMGMMRERDLLDLEEREGKAAGGFCTYIPDQRVPFIFATFNGTKRDVEIFTHEAGHAFQGWKSSNASLLDYVWPTTEACEIHSMSLEFLTWPEMELFFGTDADRFRRIHLIESLLFIPYGVAVDHFQHLVYEKPEATPRERHEMWRQTEELYLPWRQYGDLKYLADGGFWQRQRHIYLSPFYYIDYVLATTCALQFWEASRNDRENALERYVSLCERGGEAPFQELVRSAGLRSPFERGVLTAAVSEARRFLGI